VSTPGREGWKHGDSGLAAKPKSVGCEASPKSGCMRAKRGCTESLHSDAVTCLPQMDAGTGMEGTEPRSSRKGKPACVLELAAPPSPEVARDPWPLDGGFGGDCPTLLHPGVCHGCTA
jgi:hypothetical protein